MERSSVDIYYLEEARLTGKLVRMISGKEAQSKLFQIGNEKNLPGRVSFLFEE